MQMPRSHLTKKPINLNLAPSKNLHGLPHIFGMSHMGVGSATHRSPVLLRLCTMAVSWCLPQLSALEVSTRSPTQPIFSRLSSLTRAYSSNSRKT